jgi:hypothetical protein
MAADTLARPFWVLGPVESPPCIRQRRLFRALALHACPSRQRGPHSLRPRRRNIAFAHAGNRFRASFLPKAASIHASRCSVPFKRLMA